MLSAGIPSVAAAQTDVSLEFAASAMEWWAIFGALLTGALISLSKSSPEVDRSESIEGESDETDADKLDGVASHSNTPLSQSLVSFALIVLAFVLVCLLTLVFPAVFILGAASVILFLLALPNFDILQRGPQRNKDWKRLFTDRNIGLMAAVFLLAALLLNAWLDIGDVGEDDLLISGIAVALAAGLVFGGLISKTQNLSASSESSQKLTRRVAGVAMIALAIFVAGRTPQVPALPLWSVLFIILAVYCGATSRLRSPASSRQQLLKGGGIVVLLFGVIGLVSASFGYRDFNEPFTKISELVASGGTLRSDQVSASSAKVFTYVTSMDEFDQMLVQASQSSKPVMIDYYADWCLDCKRMDRTTFKDPSIVATLSESFQSIKVDVTDPNDGFSRAIRKRYQVFGPPALLFIDSSGNLTPTSPAYGYFDVEELTGLLTQVQSG